LLVPRPCLFLLTHVLGEDSPSTQISLGTAYARGGEREKARAILKGLQTTKEYVSPGELAVLHLSLGDREEALALLKKAYEAHDLQLQYLKVDPQYDSLRSDPRFQTIMQGVGLPQ
jgi:adenylate cyclase